MRKSIVFLSLILIIATSSRLYPNNDQAIKLVPDGLLGPVTEQKVYPSRKHRFTIQSDGVFGIKTIGRDHIIGKRLFRKGTTKYKITKFCKNTNKSNYIIIKKSMPTNQAIAFAYPSTSKGYVRSGFGRRRVSLRYRRYRFHSGVDLAINRGTPVLAAANGVVTYIGRNGNYGRLVKIKHKHGYSTRYAHLLNYKSGLKKGSVVKQGDIIAYIGTSGRSTGYHLHFEIRKDGKALNPMKFIKWKEKDKSKVILKK